MLKSSESSDLHALPNFLIIRKKNGFRNSMAMKSLFRGPEANGNAKGLIL